MEYEITEKQCLKNIRDGNVCSRCGGVLGPIETVDNAHAPTFWPGCKECCTFDHGVPADRYKIAKELVENRRYIHYSHIEIKESDNEETKAYKNRSQICGACDIVRDVLDLHKEISTDQE